jgi:hypothetical protein
MKASTTTPTAPRPRTRPRTLKPWLFGVIAGVLFVAAEVLLGIYPPSAYAFCLACHVRDLVNTAWNAMLGAALETTGLAKRALLLTSPGVLLGAFAAAALYRERRRQPLERPLLYFLAGLAVMSVGIAIFGCPTRIVLRAGYGEVYGIAALAGMLAGIFCGTLLLRLRNRGT